MEAERKREKKERQVSEKNTPYNIKEQKSQAAAEARESNPALMRLYELFMPGSARFRGMPKYITDKYGNRVRTGVQIKVDE